MERDGTRLFSARIGDAAVEAPQRRQPRVAERFAHDARRPAERRGSLGKIVLHQPRFGESGADGNFVVPTERGGSQKRGEQLHSVGAPTPDEGGAGSGNSGMGVS